MLSANHRLADLPPSKKEAPRLSRPPLRPDRSCLLQDAASQAGLASADAAVQSDFATEEAEVQCESLQLSAEQRQEQLESPSLAAFLQRILPRYEHALQQNDIVNVYEDDFAGVGDAEGGEGGLITGKGPALTEVQSFTDLARSKGRMARSIDWHPNKRGLVAVSYGTAANYSERSEGVGMPPVHHILVWNLAEALRPDMVLESPEEVIVFRYNPLNPEMIAAGCLNGQVALWDTSPDDGRAVGASFSHGPTEEDMAWATSEQGLGTQKSMAVSMMEARSKDRNLARPCQMSSVEFGPRAPVTDLAWLPSFRAPRPDGRPHAVPTSPDKLLQRCNVFATAAADGRVLFWDITAGRRKKVKRKDNKGDEEEVEWRPIYFLSLISTLKDETTELACSRLCFRIQDHTQSTFFVGSNDGQFVRTDLVPSAAKGTEDNSHQPRVMQGHCLDIVSMQRSPFMDDVILTVGDWTWMLWREVRHDSACIVSPPASAMYTAGCWSPTRAGVVYMARMDGQLEVWDMVDRTHEPVASMSVCAVALTSLAFNPVAATLPGPHSRPAPQLLAAGDSHGVLHTLEVPRGFRRPMPNENATVQALLDRQLTRLAYLDTRKPLRVRATQDAQMAAMKARQEEAAAAKAAAKAAETPQPTTGQQATPEVEDREYHDFERDIRIKLGLPPP